MKLTLGKKITKKDLEKKGFKVRPYAAQILEKVTFSKKREVELKIMTLAELGFTEYTRYDTLCAKIKELGYELCPAEVAPALRMAYQDQPTGEWLLVAMEPIPGAGGGLGAFGVVHDGVGRWLSTYRAHPDFLYGPRSRVVFVVSRQVSDTKILGSRPLVPSEIVIDGVKYKLIKA